MMYVPILFRPRSFGDIREVVQEHAFATLVGRASGKTIAAHIPLLWVEDEAGQVFLEGHVARGNEMGIAVSNAEEPLLAIFQGPHAYISSSWYTHENVPTWNYLAVHVRGRASVLEDEALRDHLKTMVDKYEIGRESRFMLEQMEAKALAAQMRGIIGFRIQVEGVEASFKLSQNRNETDHRRVIAALEASGDALDAALADAMKKYSQPKK
jgi:transcriptional regulator